MPVGCTCDPKVDERRRAEPRRQCYECASGRISPYAYGFLPRECCLGARPARPDEATAYRLHDPGWFICPACTRAFGRHPREMRTHAHHRTAP